MSDVVAEVDYPRARRLLMSRDPVIGPAIIKAHGPCGLAAVQRDDPFHALVEAIVSQQLSSKAAATIFGRFVAQFPAVVFPPRTRSWARAWTGSGARASAVRIGYIHDLCRRILDGSLRLDALDRMEDEAVIEALTEVKGIGRWTAEMFLMFKLHRPDVLPVDDLGIVKAIQRAYRLRKLPRPDRILRIGEAWRRYDRLHRGICGRRWTRTGDRTGTEYWYLVLGTW